MWPVASAITTSPRNSAAAPNSPSRISRRPSNSIPATPKLTSGWASACARKIATPRRARHSPNPSSSTPTASGPGSNWKKLRRNETTRDRCRQCCARAAHLFSVPRPHLAPAGQPDLRPDPGTPARPRGAAQRHPGAAPPRRLYPLRRNRSRPPRHHRRRLPRSARRPADRHPRARHLGPPPDGRSARARRRPRTAGGCHLLSRRADSRPRGPHLRIRAHAARLRRPPAGLCPRPGGASPSPRRRSGRGRRLPLPSAHRAPLLGPLLRADPVAAPRAPRASRGPHPAGRRRGRALARLDSSQEFLQRMRTAYVWISTWPAATIVHHLLILAVLVAAFVRIRPAIGVELRVLLLGLGALGLLTMPLSWLLLEQFHRSEERRVGKECRSRWSPD